MNDRKDKAAGLGGALLLGCLITGLAGLLVAFLAIMNDHDFSAACLGLAAAAVAFGLGANAVFRQ